jgi:hypothetical protein
MQYYTLLIVTMSHWLQTEMCNIYCLMYIKHSLNLTVEVQCLCINTDFEFGGMWMEAIVYMYVCMYVCMYYISNYV